MQKMNTIRAFLSKSHREKSKSVRTISLPEYLGNWMFFQPVHSEGDQPWDFFGRSWNSSTLATSCKELTHWKRLWCWEGVGARGEGDDRGWNGWIASLTWWTWVWVNSRSWWWTGRSGVLQFMGSQRVGYDWATDLIWSDYIHYAKRYIEYLLAKMK